MTHPRVLAGVFAAGGAWIVTAGEDALIRVWNVADGRLLKTLAGHGAAVGALAVAPDGVTIASASDDHMVKLWRLQTGDLLKTLSFHTDEVWSLAFSPNGGTLLSGDKAGMIAKWDVGFGILRGTMSLDPRLQGTMAIAFAPDGMSFATTHPNGNATLWSLFGSGSHRTVPVPPLVESSVVAGTTDQRTYAHALDLIDSYQGDDRPLRDAEALLKGLLDTNSKAAALAGLSRIAFKRALINRDTFDEAGVKSALELAERSLAIDPTLADGFVAKGWALRGRKDVVGARAAVETARRLAPESARVRLLEAALTAEDGETARAEQLYGETLSRPMTRFLATVAYGYLRDVYWDLGDMDAVEQCDRKAIDLEPEAAWPKGNYAYLLLEKGDVDGAIGMAQAALNQMDYGMARRALADAYCARGHEALWDGHDPEMAKRAFDNAARVGSTGACAAYGLGAYHQYRANKEGDRGELSRARSAYERAAALDPKDALVQKALAALQ
jgi:tetratricopeptide (TPR) repeat protein